jgi:paraquat-inducible protein B
VEASNIATVSESVTRCATQVESLAKHLDEIVVAAGPEAIGEDLKTTLSALASLSQTLDQTVPSLTMEATETMASINEVTTDLSPIVKAWGESEAMLTLPEDTSGAVQQVLQTLRVLEALLQSLRERPSRIIFDDEM